MKIKKLSEGAEARIYSAKIIGMDSILKRRTAKSYRIKEIDETIRTRRTKSEARIISLVSSLGINSPILIFVDKYDIFMSRINGINLNDLMNSGKDLGKIFSTLGTYAAILHNNNIIHGDYTPANVIIDKNFSPCVIDFGLSDMTNSIEDKALDLLLMKRSISTAYFDKFCASYKKNCEEGALILKRLSEIEKRGRYNTRSLLVI